MKEKFLPLGSVVLLKNATKRLMITGFYVKADEKDEKTYDYVGCLYPEGVISSKENCVFNHEQIDKIFFIGYSDDEEKRFKEKLNKAVTEYMSLQNLSIKEIEYKLYSKGISNDIIEKYFSSIIEQLEEYELQSAKNIILKKQQTMSEDEIKIFLRKKGYNQDTIKQAFSDN